MSTVLTDVTEPETQAERTAFNLAVWKKLQADEQFARLDFRIETDQHGQIIITPPPAPSHGNRQSEIARILGNWNPGGRVVSECPISTSHGVKAADVAWCSEAIWEETQHDVCFTRSPEICVEVISPSNTKSEIREKKRLYFEAGADEVWYCLADGSMKFFLRTAPDEAADASDIYADFPAEVG